MKNNGLIFFSIIILALTAFVVTVNALDISGKKDAQKLENMYLEKYTEEELELNYKQTLLANEVDNYIKKSYDGLYPSYFGGIYISDDSKNLIVQIVKEYLPKENSNEYIIYNRIINMDEDIIIEYVNNSFNDLSELQARITDIMTSKTINNEYINGTSINIIDNNIQVELTENTKEKQALLLKEVNNFKNDLKSNMIDFRLSKGESKPLAYTIKAGGPVEEAPQFSCSMGFRTKYNGKNGFVTAGHCTKPLKKDQNFGKIEIEHYDNNQKYDYAFVATTSNYNPVNNLNVTFPYKKLAVVNYSPNVFTNTIIGKVGRASAYTQGKVTYLNQTVKYDEDNDNDVTILGLVASTLIAREGDSGGVVFLPSNSTDGVIPVGVVSGGNLTTNTMYFTNINNMGTLQTGRY